MSNENIQVLSGGWRLKTDPRNQGKAEGWFQRVRLGAKPAPVPGIVQQIFPAFQGVAWYWHSFTPLRPLEKSERAFLRFGAVEYFAEVWLNGIRVGGHEGAETPFAFDVTDALQPGKNLLAVRVLKPGKKRIDGLTLDEIPHRCQFVYEEYQPGRLFNTAGMIGRVELAYVPEMRIDDIFARPNAAEGRIDLTLTLQNDTGRKAEQDLVVVVAAGAGGDGWQTLAAKVTLPPGSSSHEVTITLQQPRLWQLDDPFLYSIAARLGAHEKTVRCGLRDFRVRDGFFHLNGKRIFLRSSHLANHFPITQLIPPEPDLMRRDLLNAKAAGFNCLRFIAGVALPEQLDFCDEIGLMVYEETYAAWVLGDSPQLEERYHRSYREMILRDRNHPSVVIWGLINEMPEGKVFRCAVDYLPQLRQLDPTRAVLLASGRWDGDPKIGTMSNPGSAQWEPVWGVEGPDAPEVDKTLGWHPGGYLDRAGDAHVYPYLPIDDHDRKLIRTLGEKTKPVFLSEGGVGSQHNVIDEVRRFDRLEARNDLSDRVLLREMESRFVADWQRLGFRQVYPFPVDFFRASYRHQSAQRRMFFDIVRSNPRLCGYNITGFDDHVLTGEGLFTFWRQFKPGIVDVLEDGWAPLRWCLFVTPGFGYIGKPLEVEAVLANEDVLKPGKYPVTFRIWNAGHGTVWEKRTVFTVRKDGPLALPVLKTRVMAKFPAGTYTLAADLEHGAAKGDRLDFYLGDSRCLPRGKGTVRVWGLEKRACDFLHAHGYTCVPYRAGKGKGPILIGNKTPHPDDSSVWEVLRREIMAGARALVLGLQPFRTDGAPAAGGERPAMLAGGSSPWGKELESRQFHDWLYHRDSVAKLHPIFEGLPGGGLLDWSQWGQVIGHNRFDSSLSLEEAVAAAFAVGYCCPGGYDMGVLVGRYRWRKGRMWINAFPVLEHLGQHPLADRLLLNLVTAVTKT